MPLTARTPDVVVVGSVHMDLLARGPRLPRPGESLVGSSFAMHPGGKAGNQAVAAARQGAHTVIVARLGDDQFGRELQGRLEAAGVDVSFLQTDEAVATGASPILSEDGGDYASIIVPGASLELTPERLSAADGPLRSCRVLLLQLEISPDTSLAAAEISSREQGVGIVLLNAAPAPTRLDDSFHALLARADVLMVNRVEAEAWSGIAVHESADAGRAGAAMRQRYGIDAVVVTLGGSGVVLVDADRASSIPGYPARVVDTVGAGDALAGAVAAALARGESLRHAVELGNAAGALAVQRQGGYEAAPTLAETVSLLNKKTR